jgi:hypothetical protein
MELALKATNFLNQIRAAKYNDFLSGAGYLETLIDFVTKERMFDSHVFLKTVAFFSGVGRLDLLQDVGQVLLPILKRYWGPGVLHFEVLSCYLDDPSTAPYWEGWDADADEVWLSNFHDLLPKVASNIISCLKDFP